MASPNVTDPRNIDGFDSSQEDDESSLEESSRIELIHSNGGGGISQYTQ